MPHWLSALAGRSGFLDRHALPWNVQNWIQAVSWAAAAFGVATGFLVGIRQRHNELKWKRADAAKSLNDELMADDRAADAMLMVDYIEGRSFNVPSLGPTWIDHARIVLALTHEFGRE